MNTSQAPGSMETNASEAPVSDLVRKIGIKLRQKGDRLITELGLTVQQGRTIDYIAANEHAGVIQRDIADISGRRSASVTSMLQGLEDKGYIERKTSEADERQKNLYVLPKGRAIIHQFQAAMRQGEQELLEPLTEEEQRTLLILLNKIDSKL